MCFGLHSRPHPQPFSQREKGAGSLSLRERVGVRDSRSFQAGQVLSGQPKSNPRLHPALPFGEACFQGSLRPTYQLP